jgi:hypothetical protein
MKWLRLTENQIQKARSEGQLDGLEGEGKPLEFAGDGSSEAVGLRIMADAGVVPREIELKKAVQAQQEVRRQAVSEEARKAAMRKLADLQLRLNIEQEARRRFYRTQ